MVASNFVTVPEWMFFGSIGIALIAGIAAIFLLMMIWGNPMIKVIIQAKRSGNRLAMIHYPSGQVRMEIPKLVEEGGEGSPYWEVGGAVRFKDTTGEKWESFDDIKILHYSARSPVPIGSRQFLAIDQLNDLLAWNGFSTKGYLKEVFWMIGQAAKGEAAEREAWENLAVQDINTRTKIREILTFIKENPEVKYIMFRTGAFTYQTAVSVIDQIIGTNVSVVSDTISFVEDRTRRKLSDRTSELMKWMLFVVPVITALFIGAAVLFTVLNGSGAA